MAARKFTDEQELEICRRYEAGENTMQLAKDLGANDGTISRILKRNGVKTRWQSEVYKGQRKPHLRRFTDEQESDICHRYLAGENSVQLARAVGISRTAMQRVLAANGMTMRARGPDRQLRCEQEQEICRRYTAGENSPQLGSEFGVASRTVISILRRNGTEVRTKGQSQRRRDEEEITKRYIAGENTMTISRDLNISSTTVSNILKRCGVEARQAEMLGDSMQHILDCTGRHSLPRECEFYLFELARYSDTHCKPGIAFETDSRVRCRKAQGEYGTEVLRLVLSTRAEAYLLEQAVLDATRGSADCPADMTDWIGATEVRAMPASDMEPIVLRLADELEELGLWEFAARYVPMTAAQRATCQQRAMQEVAA